MSYYDVKCEACGFTKEDHEQPLTLGFPSKCPACKKKKLFRDYSAPPSVVFQDLTPKTVGQQAERNRKKAGEELHELQAKQILGEAEFNKRKNPVTPWWRPGTTKPIDIGGIKNVDRFIETGEKG